jgi:hypothetical protein
MACFYKHVGSIIIFTPHIFDTVHDKMTDIFVLTRVNRFIPTLFLVLGWGYHLLSMLNLSRVSVYRLTDVPPEVNWINV